jgi:hypothetical protein
MVSRVDACQDDDLAVLTGSVKYALDWLIGKWNWPGAAAFCGCVLLFLAPLVWAVGGESLFWIFLQLPIYMIHQLEEHAGDRFRTFINTTLGGGVEVLSRPATFVINSVGVWGLDLLALYLAVFVGPGWGLMAMYLPLINAVGHIGQAIAMRCYNPGLITAVITFLPLAGWGLFVVSRASNATWLMQVTGFGVALLVHIAIIVHVKLQLSRSR